MNVGFARTRFIARDFGCKAFSSAGTRPDELSLTCFRTVTGGAWHCALVERGRSLRAFASLEEFAATVALTTKADVRVHPGARVPERSEIATLRETADATGRITDSREPGALAVAVRAEGAIGLCQNLTREGRRHVQGFPASVSAVTLRSRLDAMRHRPHRASPDR
jgi:hypothetical protein